MVSSCLSGQFLARVVVMWTRPHIKSVSKAEIGISNAFQTPESLHYSRHVVISLPLWVWTVSEQTRNKPITTWKTTSGFLTASADVSVCETGEEEDLGVFRHLTTRSHDLIAKWFLMHFKCSSEYTATNFLSMPSSVTWNFACFSVGHELDFCGCVWERSTIECVIMCFVLQHTLIYWIPYCWLNVLDI